MPPNQPRSLTRLRLLSIAIAFLSSPTPALPFDCLRMPGPIREHMPDPRDPRTAVFIGQVRRISPGRSAFVHIAETFTGPPPATEIELEGLSSDSFRFSQNETYLIEAYRAQPGNPWTASICAHTRLLRDAAADVTALRAWKNSRRVPCDLAGALWARDDSTHRSGIGVRLAAETKTLQTVTDPNGRFLFKDVPNGAYKIIAAKPGWNSQSVTVTDSLCPNGDLYPR